MNWLILADTNGQQAPTVRPTLSERQASRSLPVHTASITMNLRSEEHTSELQSHVNLVCRLLLEKKKTNIKNHILDPVLSDLDLETEHYHLLINPTARF